MSNLRDDIKVPTDEEKKAVLVNILCNMINSGDILSSEQIRKRVSGIGEKLSEDEFTAIYSLAVEIKKSILVSKNNEKLFEFLNISEYCQNDNGNLLKFINATVQDISQTREFFPGTRWYLQVGKIFDRMAGKNPYGDEMKYEKIRTENIHIVE